MPTEGPTGGAAVYNNGIKVLNMRVMGVEFSGSEMNWVLLTRNGTVVTLEKKGHFALNSTRVRADALAFQSALRTVLQDAMPDRIAVKIKPERGRPGMVAGPAALKMEAILLVSSPRDVEFISPQKLKSVDPVDVGLPKYLQTAAQVAMAVE